MAKLGAADMRSKASAGDYAGQSRVDIFDLKIKDKKGKIDRHSSN